MATRTRSRSKQSEKGEGQAKLTDTFSVSRKNVHVATNSVKQTIIEQDVKPTTSKTIARTKRIKKEVVIPNDEIVIHSLQPPALESPPRRRKTPTPNNSPRRNEESAASTLEFPFEISEKKAAAKIRTRDELQARLAAANPALTKVHEQLIASKSKQVEERVAQLRSPAKDFVAPTAPVKKIAPFFTSPVKRPSPIMIGAKTSAAYNVPEFILPAHKTPVKEVDEEEEMRQRDIFGKGLLARLNEDVKKSSTVKLPGKYMNLLERFESLDRVVSILDGRGMRCSSIEVFKNVTNKIRMNFDRNHLAQIITVYPKSYRLHLEELRQISGKPNGQYDLVIDPNLVDDLAEFMNPESPVPCEEPLPKVLPGPCQSPMKSPRKKVAMPVPREAEIDFRPRLEGWRMSCRKYVMHHLLVEKIVSCHALFLKKIGVVASSFKRFHPTFMAQIDKECSDIELAPLPEPPRKGENLVNVSDFMKSVKLPTTAVDMAIEELKTKNNQSVSRNIPLSPRKFAECQAAKPKGAMSLLERIRAKEAAKKAVEAQRDPEAEKRYFRLNLLHEKIMRPLLLSFVRTQCRSMELNKAIEKVEATVKSPKSELRASLELLCSLATPDIIQIVEVCSNKYLQIEKSAHQKLREIVKTTLQEAARPEFPVNIT